MVRQGLEQFGHIDILVNSVGSRPGRDRVPVVELEEDAWDKEFNINTKGNFLCCRTVARHMIDRGGGGKIINIASTSGRHARPRFAAYCVSKAALLIFTLCLACELGAYHINVNAISPTAVDSERTGYIAAAMPSELVSPETWRTSKRREEFINNRVAMTPLGRVADGSDVARTAAFLASSESDYLTGIAISVTGGSELD